MYLLIPWSVFRNSVILTAIGSPWGKEGENGMEKNLQPKPLVQLSYSYSPFIFCCSDEGGVK